MQAAPVQVRFPEVLSRGGPVINNPRVLPILFAGDTNAAHVKSFSERVGRDPYWTTVASEYGVGPLTAKNPIIMTPAPKGSITSLELEEWLVKKLTEGTFGQPDPGTLYAIFTPPNISLAESSTGTKACEAFAE